jgi:hypothetical protein
MPHYKAPTPADLQALKTRLGNLTGKQMADLAGLAGDHQWRKYTGGQAPRELGLHMAFFMAARLALTEEELGRVLAEMRAMGAEVDLTE